MSKSIPPFGKNFQRVPASGVRVAIGPGAWSFARTHHRPIMVLPHYSEPKDFLWPSDGKTALVYERGPCNDDRLQRMAKALLVAGASSVVAIREAHLEDSDPRVFFDPEVRYALD